MSGLSEQSNESEDAVRSAKEAEFEALIEQYRQRFGKEPDWWVLGSSDDKARDIRDAIQSGNPIVLNIPPDAEA